MSLLPHLSIQDLQRACFELEVFVHDRPVGVLYESNGSFHFQYAHKVAQDDFVSLLLPVRNERYTGEQPNMLLPAFDMNLPEGSLRGELLKRYSKVVTGFNDLALLSLVGRTLLGRVTVGGARMPAAHRLDVDALMQSEDAEALLEQLYTSDAVLSGIAGAQPKVIADIDYEDLVKFSDKLEGNAETRKTLRADGYIVKTNGAQTPWLVANEYHCLRAASLSGLDVPDVWLFRDGQVLVVSRFDRSPDNQAYGAEDFCALNGLTAVEKYSSSYERVSKTLGLFTQQEQRLLDNQTLFHSLVISCVLRNGDAHLKNFTLLYKEGEPLKPRLSPLYDVCTTNVYLPNDMLALTLAGSKRYPTKKALDLLGLHRCGLSTEVMESIYDQIEVGVNQAAQEMIIYANMYPKFGEQIGIKMLNCWKSGLVSIERHLDIAHQPI